MGTWGTSPFENDNAADFVVELSERLPDDRPALIRQRLAVVASSDESDHYVAAPEADEAFAAAALLVLAAGQPLPGSCAPADRDAQDVARSLPPPDLATTELATAALARIVTADRSEWLDLWEEAGELAAAKTRVLELTRSLSAVDPGPAIAWEADPSTAAPPSSPPAARRRWWRR